MLHWQRGIAIFFFITKFKAEYISYLKKLQNTILRTDVDVTMKRKVFEGP